MSTLLPHGSTGINLTVTDDDTHLARAAELETLGYDTLWLSGGQLDRLDRVTEVLRATSTVRVATGIVPLGVFDTASIAALHHELATDHPGRFVLGLGGPQQARPMVALRGLLAELDAAGVPPHERLLAALGPRKVQLARERTAGAITLLTTPASTAATRERLGAGPTLAVHQLAVLDTDADRARAAAREPLGFLSGVAGYRANFVAMGFTEDDVDALSDRLVDALVVRGDADVVAERIAAHRAAGADHVNVSFLPTSGSGDGAGELLSASASGT